MQITQHKLDAAARCQQIMRRFDAIYRNLPAEKLIELAEEHGREQGFERGRKEGEVARVRIAQRALKLPVTPREELLGWSLLEVMNLGDHLEAQLPTE